MNSQFVENDPRRGGGSNVTYVVDQSDGSALSFATFTPRIVTLPNSVTEAAIDRSMNAWTNSPNCPGPESIKRADSGGNIDLIDDLVFGGPVGSPTADITHGGWLPRAFFNAIAPPNGGSFILGVTFTFIFVDNAGNPTDLDNNGRLDVAFREIYYNRNFGWSVGTLPELNVDVESVATHEAGHAFGLGHFGKVFLKEKTGQFQFSPRAMMNAVYISPFRELAGTDNASFCQIWANSHWLPRACDPRSQRGSPVVLTTTSDCECSSSDRVCVHRNW